MRPIYDIAYELRPEGQLDIVAIDIAHPFLIHDEEMIVFRAAGDIDVLAQFDVAVGAENEEPAVTPHGKTVGSEPVDPNITRSPIAMEHHVSEILELRML